MQALFDLGVDSIVTDDVATGLDVLNRQRPRRHRGMGEWTAGRLLHCVQGEHPSRKVLDMSERSLRGTQLGSRSLETEEGVEPAPRQMVEFECEDGTRFKVPFSIEAEVPSTWDSGIDGIGVRVGVNEPDGEPVKHVRSHWNMLLERRSFDELQLLLDERLAIRRGEVPAQS